MARTAEDIVRVEVHYCVSALVSTLASGWHVDHVNEDMNALHEQAQELCYPLEDWEEAAREAGWKNVGKDVGEMLFSRGTSVTGSDIVTASSWQELCEENDIEPYQREVFEHWIVSDWLADRLAEKGEKVDKDFAGLTVWARTTTGQGIASDWVIEQIAADLNKGA